MLSSFHEVDGNIITKLNSVQYYKPILWSYYLNTLVPFTLYVTIMLFKFMYENDVKYFY